MENKKSILITMIVTVLVIALGMGYILYVKHYKTNSTISNISSNVSSMIEDISWDNVTENEVTLTKSIKITEEGTYTLTGKIDDGLIYINTSGKVKLILNEVSITNSSGPAIYVENAEVVEIYTNKGTTNKLEDGVSYTGYEENVIGCIYSKDDLVLSGEGTLEVTANNEDAIVSKDDLKITSGTYNINANDDGIRGKDSIEITNGVFNITSNGDAIKSTDDTDENKGFILISNGTFNIVSVCDGIEAETSLVIENGTFNITTGNSKNTSNSAKGIKAGNSILIKNGTFTINSVDDGIHSNGNIGITGGTFTINSSDDAIHADGLVEINDGKFELNAHEGIEGTYVKINDGTINISATDDGINATRKVSNYATTIEINGGNITIKMASGDTDGIDSNGDLYINGGTINITGQSPFDYDGNAKYTGGTIIVNGEITNTITNQFMGGGMGGRQPFENNGDKNDRRNHSEGRR